MVRHRFPNSKVYVFSRNAAEREFALGLGAAYYANPRLEGAPALTRVDPAIDFIWEATTPVTGRIADAFSVRWTGALIPPESGTYKLGVRGCSGYRLYLDGDLIIELDFWYGPITRVAEIELEAGHVYDLRLEYMNRHFDHDPQRGCAERGQPRRRRGRAIVHQRLGCVGAGTDLAISRFQARSPGPRPEADRHVHPDASLALPD